MFNILKNKLKQSFESITKKFSSREKEEQEEEKVKQEPKKKELKKPKTKKKEIKKTKPIEKEQKIQDEIEEVDVDEVEQTKELEDRKEEPKSEKRLGLFDKLITKKITDEDFEKMFEPFEMSFLEANIAFEVISKIKEVLKTELLDTRTKRGKGEDVLKDALRNAFNSVLFEVDEDEFMDKLTKKPFKIMFVGVNGVGKTTSLAKFCNYLQNKNKSCVISASDTFRAASIEQLEKHADRLNVKLVKHTYGSDAAAVAFDAVKHAEAKRVDVVLIDTAGRSHSNSNLMEELSKVKRVVKPDITIFVGDSLTGNDVVQQANIFNEKIGIDYVILTKSDVDQKGGAIISVSYVTKKPILFLGMGQEYKDLVFFKKEEILNKIGF